MTLRFSSQGNEKIDGRWKTPGTSLVVQWLRFCASIAGGVGWIPVRETIILHASKCSKMKKYIKMKWKAHPPSSLR